MIRKLNVDLMENTVFFTKELYPCREVVSRGNSVFLDRILYHYKVRFEMENRGAEEQDAGKFNLDGLKKLVVQLKKILIKNQQ